MSGTNPSDGRGEPFERRPSAPEPLVSVVVPVFNAERWLPETLSDLLGQTLRDAEFVFVDDGSTDGSARLLEEAAARDPRVRVLRQERKYAGCARNLGLDAARGTWFIALDADDRFEPTLLEEAVRRGKETDAQIVLFDADELAMPDGIRVPRPSLARASRLPAGVFRPSEDTCEAFRVTATWNKLYRLDYVRENGFRYQETFECNDIRFVFLSMAKATRVAALPRILLHYRVGLSDNVQSQKDEHPFDVVAAYASLRRELERAGLWERFRKVYATRATISLAWGRFAGFRSAGAARAWYDRIRSYGLAELGLDDLSDDDFVGPDAERLRARFRDFRSLPFDEWVWEAFRQSRRSNDWLRLGNSKTRESLRGAENRLARTESKLARAKTKLAEAKLLTTRLERASETLRRSLSFRLGFAITAPVRFVLSAFRRPGKPARMQRKAAPVAAGAPSWVVAKFKALGKAVARALHPYRPKISVVVANYNYGNYIGETLDSLVAQTYRNFEVLVVDNGSTDDSVAVVRRHADRHPFIRLLQHEGCVNKGLPASVKLGIDEAAGEFVAFCESDDQWTPDHLEKIVRFMDRHDRKPSFVVNDFEPFGDSGRIEEIEKLAEIFRPALKRERNRISPLDFRRRNWIFTFSCCMVRRAVLQSCDILSVPRPSNVDWWLWRQICLENDIYAIHEKLTRWRLHEDSFTVRDRNPDSEADGSDMVSLEDRLLVERNPSEAKDLEPLLRPEDGYSVDGEGTLVGPDGFKTGVQPSFSIVVACGGAAAGMLAKTLASIDAQTYRGFDVVLGGAGETADFAETVPDGIADRVSKSGAGDGTTLGTLAAGAEKAGGDWIVFLLPGDRMRPEHLKSFAARIVRESDPQAFFGRAICGNPRRASGAVHADSRGASKVFAPLGAFACRKALLSGLARKTGTGRESLPCATILATIAERGESAFFDHFVLLYDDAEDGRDPFGGELQRETDAFLSGTCGFPVVTTAVLTYDHAPHVAQAIESALAQRGRFVHDILVADNGSTDGTWDVVEGVAREHPGRIRAVRNAENIGISGNFRKAISLARGKYVCILEGDDYWCSASKVGKQVKYLEANPDCSMVFSRTKTLKDGKTGLLKYQERLPEKMRGEDLASRHEGSVIANFSSTMFRRDLIASLPDSLYEGRVSEVSIPFYLERFGPIGYIPEALSVYRIHPGGTFSGATRLERCRQKRMCRVQALSVCRPECRKALEEIVGRIDAELESAGEVP